MSSFCWQWETVSFIHATRTNIYPQLSSDRSPGNFCYHQKPPCISSIQSVCQESFSWWEVVCISSPLLSLLNCQHFVKVAGVKKKKEKKGCSIWVVGIALTASLWPHWLFYFWLQCSNMSSDSLGLFVLIVIYSFFFLSLSFSLLISYPRTLWVDFVACETWYFNPSLIWSEGGGINILSVWNLLTLVKMNKIFAFFKKKKKSRAMYIW